MKQIIEYFKGFNEGDNITITCDFITNIEELIEENQSLNKQLEDIFNEYINCMDKQDFAKKCNISRPYLDKLLKSGMTRNEIHNYCLIRNKIKGSGINE